MSSTNSSLTWPTARIRQQFVDYFVEKCKHKHVPSAPVVPLRDPTILFVNSGMVQFKSIFLGTADPATDFGKMTAAVDSQLCIRAGGKHNDLDDVGRDTYHHTFFEMLGNWAFNGTYFKKEAITWAWDLLTNVYGIDKDRLYVTYFEGSERYKVPPDHETRDLWKSLGVPDDRILTGNMKDNFWEMGDTGPCGPCTEIHYDKLGGRNASNLVNKDDETVIEVWNLVFMQFNRKEKGGDLTKLPAVHVDAGMGLERLAMVLQKKNSNYDTDLWTGLFDAIQKVTKAPRGYADPEVTKDEKTAYCVIADHIRCLTVALSDGAMPDNVGRGFVLRRIIRRAIRFGVQFLNAETGFFNALVPAVVESLGHFFKHMATEQNIMRVQTILKDEEESFAKTWKNGLKQFEDAKAAAVAKKSDEIAPKDVFILHDRWGFPMDLTTLLAEREGLKVDPEKFAAEMAENQKKGGRVAAARTFFDVYQTEKLKSMNVPVTNDAAKYDWKDATGKVVAIFDRHNTAFMDALDAETARDLPEDTEGIVCDTTNFYFECGGQIYDTGVLETPSTKSVFEVRKVYAFAGYIVHIGTVKSGEFEVGSTVTQRVDYKRRMPIAANHTSTHLVNHALRHVLQYGTKDCFTEVNQRGSLVTEDYLRFDFSWNSKLTADNIVATEKRMNDSFNEDLPVHSALVPLKQAQEINGIRMMFDEKYPDPCTVVCIGQPIETLLADPSNEKWKDYSVELCGGTHVKSMKEGQISVIVGEEALMKGVRRLTMYTRDAARTAMKKGTEFQEEFEKIRTREEDFDDKNKSLSILEKSVNDSDVPLTVKFQLRDDIASAIKATNQAKKAAQVALKAKAQGLGTAWASDHPEGEPLAVIKNSELGADREALQAATEKFMAAKPDVAVFVMGVDADKKKALVLVTVPQALQAQCNAVEWAKGSCGKGGGKPGAAQTGVAFEQAEEAFKKAKEMAVKMAAAIKK